MRYIVLLFSLLILFGYACNVEVNQSVRIDDGTKHRDDITTVNGSITIGKDCEVLGLCRSINGNIRVGEGSTVRDIQSVNGKISIAENVRVDGELGAINGGVTIKSGVVVTHDIDVINQHIRIEGSEIGGNISIQNGDVFLRDKTTLEGNILVDAEGLFESEGSRRRTVLIEISGGSVVKGNIEVGDQRLEVKVRLRDGGKVLGEVINAEILTRDM